MSDWSWKQVVAECVLQIANERQSPDFSLEDVYAYEGYFARQFPRNRHVRDKVRQVLQQLRDDQFLSFVALGEYQLNLDYEELEGDPIQVTEMPHAPAPTKQVLRNVRLRCTFLAAELKRRYRSVCQVCRIPLLLAPDTCYAEGHHLRPLGAPHLGPDVEGNIIVLCPNHHVMFDRGAATIVPGTLRLRHVVPDVFASDASLFVEPWHKLVPQFIDYHHRYVFKATC